MRPVKITRTTLTSVTRNQKFSSRRD